MEQAQAFISYYQESVESGLYPEENLRIIKRAQESARNGCPFLLHWETPPNNEILFELYQQQTNDWTVVISVWFCEEFSTQKHEDFAKYEDAVASYHQQIEETRQIFEKKRAG